MDTDNLWTRALHEIGRSLKNEHVFQIWFSPVQFISATPTTITLEVPSKYFRDWLVERYMPIIREAVAGVHGAALGIEFVIKEGGDEEILSAPPDQDKGGFLKGVFFQKDKQEMTRERGLNSKYTFENFVVGTSNRFAHAASLAVSDSPAKAYNPLFIYGGVGLGKTHLMHAIGQRSAQKYPRSRILYISSEDFTNQLISAIQNRAMVRFRQTYRNVNLLLIDDIHFIAGKEATQEEFFHTFNTLYDAHTQIVVSSDRPPKEISALEERLVSRFEWGLVTDIQPPDFETRTAILKKKSERETVTVPDDVLYFLAEKIRSNIRELEGALIRVVAYSKLIEKEMTVDLVREILKDMIRESEKKLTVDTIQKKVADYFNISLSDMKTKRRNRAISYPRQVAMYLTRQLTDHSLPEIGEYFGGRDHTTVLHAYEKIRTELNNGGSLKEVVDKLTRDLGGA